MKISVVTAVRNDCGNIAETVNSVLSQRGEWGELEYIIIDGNSDDGTCDIIRSFEKELSAFISEKDSGIYEAMNKGIRLCTGDVIGMINSGDRYLPGALEKVAAAFASPGALEKILWGDVIYSKLGLVKGFREKNVKTGAFAPHPSMFVPRQIYDRIGLYDESFKLLGDYDFMYRAVNAEKIAPLYLPEALAFYREDGLSDRHIRECLQDELKVKLRYGQNRCGATLVYWLKLLKNWSRIRANRQR